MLDDKNRCAEFFADRFNERPEGFRFLLGHAGGGLIEKQQLAIESEECTEFDDTTGASGKFTKERIGIAGEPQVTDDLVGLLTLALFALR